ncbi:hypothetical protein GCM10023216_06600 [Isoptericola chiayiensis]|uniref:DUF4307 domain-containing protein n=1 Tax=Isoptericola chiayiensis TaxID=579446 RepID=A0ABP8Y456_9MICO|nr:DUF4307 domain-containing protein [Isoptericola chiayiensis]NOV99380.1 flagellar basal body-associated protein FliL [Isoptericola chiayiensis]
MTESSPPAVPADRYGAARPSTGRGGAGRRGRTTAVVVALVVAVLAVAGYTFWLQQDDPVEYDMVGFDVVDAETVEASFQVHMAPGTTAVCTVEALAPSYAQVGTVDVTVGPAEARTSAYEVTIGTSQEATSAVVARCAAVDG